MNYAAPQYKIFYISHYFTPLRHKYLP